MADDDAAHDVRARIVAVAVARRRAGPSWIGGTRRRRLHVVDGRQRLVLDDDRARRRARLLERLRGHDRDGLAVVADAVDREHRLVGELEPVGLAAPGTSACVSTACTPGRSSAAVDVDRDDARVRVRAPQRRAVEHPGSAEIARVGELPGHLGHCRRAARRSRRCGRARAASCSRPQLQRRRRARPRRCARSRCSGRGCRRAPRGCRRRSVPDPVPAARRSRSRGRACRSRTAPRPRRRTRAARRAAVRRPPAPRSSSP